MYDKEGNKVVSYSDLNETQKLIFQAIKNNPNITKRDSRKNR